MAYRDLETEHADFRVVFGSHTFYRNINTSQLPDETTALLIEGFHPNTENFYLAIEQREPRAFSELIKLCQQSGILIAASDPMYYDYSTVINLKREEFAKNIQIARQKGPMLMLRAMVSTVLWDFSTHHVNEDGTLLRWFNEYTDGYDIESTVLGLRNLTTAQRAWKVSEYQRRHGTAHPVVAIACGGRHIGVKESLMLTPRERANAINSHPNLRQIFRLEYIKKIPTSKYDDTTGRWKQGSIRDN